MDDDRRQFLVTGGALLSAALLPGARAATSSEPAWPRYCEAMIIDSCASPGRSDTSPTHPLDAAALADIRNSGVTAMNFTVGSVGRYSGAFEETTGNIAFWDTQIAAHSDLLMKITHGAQLDEAKRSGKLGIVYGFQDTTMYGESLDRFDLFHEFGVRIVQLTYNRRNLMGDGCMEPGNAGLSTLGRELIATMDARGVLLDLSHCGQRTTREGIEASKNPVAITHSGCVGITDTPRNKHDEELRLLADHGGVVGIYVMPYLRSNGQVMAADVIRHVEYAVNLCGEDHVGIGTDGTISAVDITPEFKQKFADEVTERRKRGIAALGENAQSYTFAPDLKSPRRMEKIAALLAQRGYGEARIEKILGGNFARLWREVIV